MRPLGRKFYLDKTGGKRHLKVNGKYIAWWTVICTPNKTREKQDSKKEIKNELT